jgi:hypothetical protein
MLAVVRMALNLPKRKIKMNMKQMALQLANHLNVRVNRRVKWLRLSMELLLWSTNITGCFQSE